MKNLYLEILKQFEDHKQDFLDQELTPIKTIDFYAGQDQDPQSFPNLFFPALFFSWNINYETEPPTATLEFRLVYENLRDTSNLSLDKKKALQFFETSKLVDNILKQIDIEEIRALHLVSEGLEVEPTVTDVYLLNYEAQYYGNDKTRIRTTEEGCVDDLTLEGKLKSKSPLNKFSGLL